MQVLLKWMYQHEQMNDFQKLYYNYRYVGWKKELELIQTEGATYDMS